ncbi:MAG: tetratricopeptide repeat protein [Myxococcales bacterium]|nr:tetratricopeptide repeat protein [Myxococcales bacterium]
MIELYSIRDVARILAVQESRLRYWTQVGFVGPTLRKGGRFYYTFADLVAVKAAKDLLAAGLPLQRVRKNLECLKKALPNDAHPASKLRVCSDGETIVALHEDIAFQPTNGQVVMAFALPTLAERAAEVLALPTPATAALPAAQADGVPQPVRSEATEANCDATAYRHFMDACAAEDAGELAGAEHLFRLALEIEPGMAAAATNLGNLLYRQGTTEEARRLYERALEHDPGQPEARYNLANVLEDMGKTELAVSELRRVCASHPEFADAHYNLGVILARLGGMAQARRAFERYLELDTQSAWAEHARTFLRDAA